ncbi:MAG: hypothetical protein U0L85_00540 [Bacilli bacterium]|nr:hypothetical protein [Bacilli bacterium]
MLNKYLKSFIVALTVFTLGFVSVLNVGAISSDSSYDLDNQVINVNGSDYVVSINNEANETKSLVTDEQGVTTEAIFNKDTGKLTINGCEIQIEESEESTIDFARVANKVLKRTTYTIPGGVTSTVAALIAGLAAISNFPFAAAVISAFISGNLWGKAIKITITEYRSGSKYTSGTHKVKYKYWTNVLVKCGSSTILNQNHSVSYK